MLHVAIFSSLRKFIESSIGNILFDVIYKTLIIIAKSQTTSAVSKVRLLPVAALASVNDEKKQSHYLSCCPRS